jgi:hypothetical protein
MGFFLFVALGFISGLLFLAGWNSIDAICACAPLTSSVANGTMGLFTIGGVVVGAVLSAICN